MMKRYEYDAIIESIKDCVNEYEERKISEYHYSFMLSNSKTIDFYYDENFIPHLLGVKSNFLKKYCKGAKSYDALKYFLENSFSIFSSMMKDGGIDANQIFSPYINQKLKVFKSNIFFRFFDIQAVVEIDREKTYSRGDEDEQLMNADYFLIRKLENSEYTYGILAFQKSERNNCSIISSMGTNSLEEFAKYFKKQNLTIPYNLIVSVNMTPIKKFWHSSTSNLWEVYANAKELKEKYDMSFCLEKYYENFYFNMTNNTKENETLKEFLNTFTDTMKAESMVTIPDLKIKAELKEALEKLVEEYNNHLYLRTPLSMNDLEQKQALEEKARTIENLETKVSTLEKEKDLKEKEFEEISKKYEEMRSTYETWQATLTSIKSMINDTPKLELEKN